MAGKRKITNDYLIKLQRRFLVGNIIFILFTIVVACFSAAAIFFLLWKFFNISNAGDIGVSKLIIVIGMLYTFASLTVALFGIINYFQSTDVLKRITELEIDFQSSARDLRVMRTMMLLMENRKIRSALRDSEVAGKFILHCFSLADSMGMRDGDEQVREELESAFTEMLNSAGENVCEEICGVFESLSNYRENYRVAISVFRNLINIYDD